MKRDKTLFQTTFTEDLPDVRQESENYRDSIRALHIIRGERLTLFKSKFERAWGSGSVFGSREAAGYRRTRRWSERHGRDSLAFAERTKAPVLAGA